MRALSGGELGALSGILLLAFVLVYLVYRLPSDGRGSATMAILSYLLQQSVLFTAAHSGAALQLLSLVNLDLLGSAVTAAGGSLDGSAANWCVVPLRGDSQRFLMSLVSPSIAFCLLAVLAAMQLGSRSLLRCCGQRRLAVRLYTLTFKPSPFGPAASDRPPVQAEVELLDSPLLPAADTADSSGRLSEDLVTEAVVGSASSAAEGRALPQSVLYYQCACVRLLQLSYSSVVFTTIRFFHTQRVAPYGERLLAFPGIATDSRAYGLLFPVMVALLVCVVCLLPVLLLLFLAHHYRRGTIDALKETVRARGSRP